MNAAEVLVLYDAALCTVPARIDGSKAPFGQWKGYQTERPSRDEVAAWFASGHPGVGVVCGAVSGNLTMLELEGRAVNLGLAKQLAARCAVMGAGEAWSAIVGGWCEVTPSGGLHFYYRTTDPALPNTKLARTADNDVLIETRGEGGFSVTSPSHGPTHPSGQPWATLTGGPATIPVLTGEQSARLFAACATFDEAPVFVPTVPPPRLRKLPVQSFNGAPLGGSWIDDVEQHLNRTTDMASLLVDYGWRHDHDAGGRSYWTRPGKESGTSGAINESGRLIVFSTSTPFEPFDGVHAPSFNLLDVVARYEHGGSREAAAHRIATDSGIFRARDAAKRQGQIGPDTALSGPESAETVDEGVLPPEFWRGRSDLEAIHRAALARMVAPTALFHCCLARVAACAPFTICIPPIVGSVVNLSYLVALVGTAETGKSSTSGVAVELLPAPAHVLDELPPGSGEGLADVLFEYVHEDDPVTGKKVRVRRQTRHNGFMYIDEGEALTALSTRGGSTLLSSLRSVFSAGPLGNTNAREETRRIVPRGRYVFGVAVSIQPSALGPLFAGVDLGTPQRFLYAETTDTALGAAEDASPDDMLAPIVWHPPTEGRRSTVGGFSRLMLTYPEHVKAAVRDRRRAIMSRAVIIDPFDAHSMLARLKVAGLLAVFDGRAEVTDEDWQRAGMVAHASTVVRDRARAIVAHNDATAEDQHAQRQGRRAATADRIVNADRIERAALAIARKVREAHEVTVAALRRSFSSTSPHRAAFDDGLSTALDRGWIIETAEETDIRGGADRRMLRPGTVTP